MQPCQHEKKEGLRGKGHDEHIAILQCQVALSLWMRFFSRASAGDVNSVIVKAGNVPHHHCEYFIATSVTSSLRPCFVPPQKLHVLSYRMFNTCIEY
jgi:hypothetical protein